MARSAGSLLFALVLCVAFGAPAQAADCDARQSAGFRIMALDNGRKMAVWYPAAAAEQPYAYTARANGFSGSVAVDAPPAACPRVPLVLFSHGFTGCGLQTIFFTEELARHGYVVAAPDHADALTCRVDGTGSGRLRDLTREALFRDPKAWTDQTYRNRLDDMRLAIARIASDAALAPVTDVTRVGAVGHSLGGYTAVGMAGGWSSWKTPEVKAVLGMSPHIAPYLANGTLDAVDVPVMYQGAPADWGITPFLEGPKGAYAVAAAPKYYVKLPSGTHFEWTNLLCMNQGTVVDCLKAKPNAYLIDVYGIAFLDRYLKGARSTLLDGSGQGLAQYVSDTR
jgi:predicted dienelactone hydrolase